MGHIKEPKGVDFIINSRPLTKEEETAISEYIRNYKTTHLVEQNAPKPVKHKAKQPKTASGML